MLLVVSVLLEIMYYSVFHGQMFHVEHTFSRLSLLIAIQALPFPLMFEQAKSDTTICMCQSVGLASVFAEPVTASSLATLR